MQKLEDNLLGNIPKLVISEREGANRQKEVEQALAIPSHTEMRDAWWRFSLGWAKRQQKKLDGTSEHVKTLGSWLNFGMIMEREIDSFRLPEQSYFRNLPQDLDNGKIGLWIFHRLEELDAFNIASTPDVPPAFASHLCSSKSRPFVALLDYLGWLALEGLAYREIGRITIDSDIIRHPAEVKTRSPSQLLN